MLWGEIEKQNKINRQKRWYSITSIVLQKGFHLQWYHLGFAGAIHSTAGRGLLPYTQLIWVQSPSIQKVWSPIWSDPWVKSQEKALVIAGCSHPPLKKIKLELICQTSVIVKVYIMRWSIVGTEVYWLEFN